MVLNLEVTDKDIPADLQAKSSLLSYPVVRSSEAAVASGQSVYAQLAEQRLASPPVAAKPFQQGHAAMASAGVRSLAVDGALIWWLLLGLGLGLMLLLGWRRGAFREPFGQRGQPGLQRRGGLLPPSGFRPNTPHERLHDPVYLQRMLEAEHYSEGQTDDPPSGS